MHNPARIPATPPLVAVVGADPGGRNGRLARMADGLSRSGLRVALVVPPESVPQLPPLSSGLRVIPGLPTDVDRSRAPESPIGAAAAAQGAECLREASIVHAAGQGGLMWAARHCGPHTRLVYDVPGDLPFFRRSPRGQKSPNVGLRARGAALLDEMVLAVGERRAARRAVAITCVGYTLGEYLQREFKLGRVPVVPLYPALPFIPEVTPLVVPGATGNFPKVAISRGDFADLETAIAAVGRLRGVELVVINGHGDFSLAQKWARRERMENRLRRVEVAPDRELATLAACQVGLVLAGDTSPRALHDIPDALFRCIMAGVPVVAGALPGVERIVARHAIGMLAETDDLELIADNVGRIATDATARDRFRHNVAVVRERRYSWEMQEQRLLALYAELLHSTTSTDNPRTSRRGEAVAG
ncbi:MAG: glycosyltransferase [Nitrospirota bacterium]|nr:glycosyltransferase [Nitrospirota bacterium]